MEPKMQLFGPKKSKAEKREDLADQKGYWPGEWLCADCGFIFDNASSEIFFEELKPGWKCPQCAGPRRRFVKKAGDMIGTLDDGPLMLGTNIVGFGVIFFGIWAAYYL